MRVATSSAFAAAVRRSTSASCDVVAPGEEVGPGEDTRLRGLAVHQHDRLEPGRPPPGGLEPLERLAVLDHGHRRLRVLRDVAALLGCRVRVDAGGPRAHRDRGEVRDVPLGPVEGQDDDPLPRLDARGHESARRLAHRVTVRAPRGLLPGPAALPGHRRPVRVGGAPSLRRSREWCRAWEASGEMAEH